MFLLWSRSFRAESEEGLGALPPAHPPRPVCLRVWKGRRLTGLASLSVSQPCPSTRRPDSALSSTHSRVIHHDGKHKPRMCTPARKLFGWPSTHRTHTTSRAIHSKSHCKPLSCSAPPAKPGAECQHSSRTLEEGEEDSGWVECDAKSSATARCFIFPHKVYS